MVDPGMAPRSFPIPNVIPCTFAGKAFRVMPADPTAPEFAIAGLPKTGSTYLHKVLRRHPEVAMPGYEVPYLDDRFYENGGVSRLRKVMRELPDEKRKGIKWPRGILNRVHLERLNELNPGMRLLLCFRDPVERLFSNYYHLVSLARLPLRDINEGLPPILDRADDPGLPRPARRMLQLSNYGSMLEQTMQVFPEQQVFAAGYGELRSRPLERVRASCAFIGVSTEAVDEAMVHTESNRSVYSHSSLRLMAACSRVSYALRDAGAPYALQNHFTHLFMGSIKRYDARFPRAPKPVLDASLRERLVEYYDPEIRKLEALTGWDCSEWRRLS